MSPPLQGAIFCKKRKLLASELLPPKKVGHNNRRWITFFTNKLHFDPLQVLHKFYLNARSFGKPQNIREKGVFFCSKKMG